MSEKPRNPFKGLTSYKRSDFGALFGRDTDFNVMRGRVFAARTTLFFAGPGVGKTSFFEAKFIPEMERRHQGELTVCYHREWTGSDPLDSVRRSLGATEGGEGLAAFFERKGGRWILVLDQFEELFQNPDYWTTSLALREELALVVNSKLPVSIVFSMREEFLGHLSFLDNKIPDVFQNYYRLRNPSRESAADIIEMTCGEVEVDGDRLGRLIHDLLKVEVPSATGQPRYLARESVFLPFLQLVCQTLWDRQAAPAADQRFVFLSDYPATGDFMSPAAKVLEDYCGKRLKRLPNDQKSLAAHALDYLVTSQGAKRAYESTALAGLMRVKKPAALKAVLDALRDAGMLRSWDRGEEHWYELAHDMYAPILYRWKGRFQEQYNEARTARLYSVVAIALVFAFTAFMFYRAKADNDLAKSLDARASYQELQQDRDQAILLRMAALAKDPTDQRRRAAAAIAYPADQLQFTLRHEAPVTALNYTADGAFIVTVAGSLTSVTADVGGSDEPQQAASPLTVVQAWDAKTGKAAGSPWVIPKSVALAAMLPSGKLLATATLYAEKNGPGGGYLNLWEPGNTTPLLEVGLDRLIDQMAFNRAGDRLLVGSSSSKYTSWAVIGITVTASGAVARADRIAGSDAARISFSPNGARVASVGKKGPLLIFDTGNGQMVTIRSAPNEITSLTFSADGTRLYTAGADRSVQVFDARTGGLLRGLSSPREPVTCMAESADGSGLLAVAGLPQHSTAAVFAQWDLSNNRLTETPFPIRLLSSCYPIPETHLVLQAETSIQLFIWDAVHGVPKKHAATDATVRQFAVSPDHRQLLTAARGTVHAWTLSSAIEYPPSIRADQAAVSRDGLMAAFLTDTHALLAHSIASTSADRSFELEFDPYGLLISSTGDYALVYTDTQAQVWNLRTGTASPSVKLPGEGDFPVSVRDDGAVIAVLDKAVWYSAFGSGSAAPLPALPPLNRQDRVALSRWGNYMALARNDVTVWDTRTGKSRSYPFIHTQHVGFTDDERYLTVRGKSAEPSLVELNSGKTLTLKHTGAYHIAISPDGHYAVTGGDEPELRIWSMEQGQQLGGLQIGSALRELAFTPAGNLFAATDRWVYFFPPTGNGGRVALPLSGRWDSQYGTADNTVHSVIRATRDWYYPIELSSQLSAKTDGDPAALQQSWENKLSLRILSGEVAPINQVRLPRSDAPRPR